MSLAPRPPSFRRLQGRSLEARPVLSTAALAGAVASVLALGGCSGDDMSRNFGLVRDAPDEFTVSTRAPLSMPPDYTLRVPRPGASRPQEQTPRSAAEAALAPQAALASNSTPETPGQLALLSAAGAPAPADIREKIDQDAAVERADRGFVDRLMFWRSSGPLSGQVVDATRESQRLRENAALGQPAAQGDTPIIQRSSRSGLLNWF
jgi:hypothetical protein